MKTIKHFARNIAAGLLAVSATISVQADKVLDRVVAVVNSEAILESQLQSAVRSAGVKSPNKAQLNAVLQQLIVGRIQAQHAKLDGIKVSKKMLNSAILGIAKRNKMNLAQFKKAVARQGIPYEQFRQNIANEILVNSLRERKMASAKVNQQVFKSLADTYYQPLQNKAIFNYEDIALPASPADLLAMESARNQAHQLKRALELNKPLKGQEALKRVTSAKLTVKQNQKGSSLHPNLRRALFSLKAGQVSEPVVTKDGVHIVRLLAKRNDKLPRVQKIKARHILRTGKTAQSDIQQLYQGIRQGHDFAELAEKYSHDRGSAVKGGDLGWTKSNAFVPAFAAQAKRLPLKQYSRPFKSQFGWHILQVQARQQLNEVDDSAVATVKKQIIAMARQSKYKGWLDDAKHNAVIEIR